ncbi:MULTISPECIES: hypothetical protein [Aeromonas]|nr:MULTISPECIES: hypothetical protein [Aeromonas]MCH7372116.1 hypothetical protein [Aeromonas sp. MR16]
MFNVLIEGGFFRDENPIRELKALKVAPREMSYLSPLEVEQFWAGWVGRG